MRDYYKAYPEALKKQLEFLKTKRSTERPDSYVIPIVFHVFGEDFNGKAVTDALVRDALRKTNEDYNGITSNYGDDNPAFDNIKKTLNITFKLAEKDPSGAATTGIVYHRLESGFGNYWAPNMALYAWDNKKYMNIYIMNDLYGNNVLNNSGVSWYPDIDMTSQNLARVVYNGAYLGTNTDENFRRVLTHEFGHFLNLAHTFDYDSSIFPDGCNDAPNGTPNPGDYVDDTPRADRALMEANDLNCLGEKTNWTNFMNYSYIRTSMFTQGQVERMLNALDHPARITLWQESNLNNTFFSDANTKRIASVSKVEIMESVVNDGSFTEKFEFELFNGTLANKTFESGTDYVVTNLPQGLIPRLVRDSDSKFSFYLDGKATSHNATNSTTRVRISFKSSMLASGELYICDLPLALDFRDAYNIKYVSNKNITISPAYGWEFVQLDDRYSNSDFGLMCDPYSGANLGNLYIESYGKQMLGNGKNLKVVEYGEAIGQSSSWTTGISSYPDLGVLVSKQYSDWKGKFAFVGFRFTGTGAGETLYGWMKISVAEDGKSFTLVDYAFNEEPGADILAGQKSDVMSPSEFVYGASKVSEDLHANDGSINQTLTAFIFGNNTFSKTGILELGTDYTLSGVPEGLTPVFEIVSDKKAILSFAGKATNNEARNSKTGQLRVDASVFTNPEISIPTLNLFFEFFDKYEIIKGTLSGVFAGASNSWTFFRIPDVNAEFGAWRFDAGHLKLETYGKPMVCNEGTRHITPLETGTQIGSNSNWVNGGSYPDQLDISYSQFKDWWGKTAYAGYSFDYMGVTLYGWFKIRVTEDGGTFYVEEWAYNQQPGEAILAGELLSGIHPVQPGLSGEVSIYPNPANDLLNINAPEKTSIAIYDMSGLLVWRGSMTNEQTTIQVSGWSKGVYLVHLSREGINMVKKIIVK